MSGVFEDRIAVVTGTASGLGAAGARKLHQEGATVVAADRNEITAPGVVPVTCDVSKEGDVQQLFQACRDRFGRVDLLVNNAGISGRPTRRLHECEATNGVDARSDYGRGSTFAVSGSSRSRQARSQCRVIAG
jgi:meso-butanediol dehydrogenase / (S,S)-butanediol dehydrogenase / diacetyl reductase